MTEAQKKLKSYTGAYVMYISEGNVVITGREKFKNFKALFPVDNVREIVGSAKSDAVIDDFDLINILKKRYRNEMVVVDALELAEDEVLAVQREQKER